LFLTTQVLPDSYTLNNSELAEFLDRHLLVENEQVKSFNAQIAEARRKYMQFYSELRIKSETEFEA